MVVLKRRLNAFQKPRKMPLSRPSCMLRATSQAAAVEAPMVTMGSEHTAHATESMARSPTVFMNML